jgi:uncharacterized protein YdaU (DUF1376 family)
MTHSRHLSLRSKGMYVVLLVHYYNRDNYRNSFYVSKTTVQSSLKNIHFPLDWRISLWINTFSDFLS